MKIMVISDLHYDRRIFKEIDESKAWSWLLSIVDFHKPRLLISLGDWGEGISEEEFYELLRKVRIWSLYGNHENMNVLKKMYNVPVNKCEPVLMRDGEIREFAGLRFGAINGIVALKRREKKGVPRKRPEEFISIAQNLKGKINVLLLHDSPWLPLPEYRGITRDVRTQTVGVAIYEVKPRLVLCGHLHVSAYTIHKFEYGTLYVRVDSSQKHKCYAILYPESMEIEIWENTELTATQLLKE